MKKLKFRNISMDSKKSVTEIWGTLGLILLILLAVFVFAVITQNLLGGGGAQASDLLSQTRDCPDYDGVSNIFDKCDCLIGDDKNDGCPLNEPTTDIAREKKCDERKKSECK